MANYFGVKATYDKTLESGKVKKVTESYLFDSLSFTESESRAIEELTPRISGEFSVKACRRTKIAEVMGDKECGRFYLAKVAFITIDEKTAAEKRSISQILVGAVNFDEAFRTFHNGMRETLADYTLVSLAETPILEVYDAKLN